MSAPSPVITPAHRRFILIETCIGTGTSGLVPAVVIWLLKGPGPVPLFGKASLATGLIGATVFPAFGLPIILSLVVRMRVAKGGAPALAWPVQGAAVVNRPPHLLVLRGLLGSAAAALLLPAPGLTLLALVGVRTLSRGQFVLYNFFHGAAVGALLFPFVVTAAMADGARSSSRPRPGS